MLLVSLALAGSGPWLVGPGANTAYLGLEAERITAVAGTDGSFEKAGIIEVDEGVSAFGAKAIVSYGFLPRLEGEIDVPYRSARTNRTDGPLCTALGDGCKPTSGIGIIGTRARWMVLDEVRGAPFTLTLQGEARFGQLTAEERGRVTNLGEGTFDIGPSVAAGRVGGLGGGYWSAWAEVGWRYRFPNVSRDTFGEDFTAPGSETHAISQATFAPGRGRVSYGPTLDFFWRPHGTELNPAYAVDPDWLAALRVLRLAGGLGVNVRAENGTTLSIGVQRNLYAENNPVDALTVTAGVTFRDLFQPPA